jgi:hypothetical protein
MPDFVFLLFQTNRDGNQKIDSSKQFEEHQVQKTGAKYSPTKLEFEYRE